MNFTPTPATRCSKSKISPWIPRRPAASGNLQRSFRDPAEELYDIQRDPLELNNLAAEPTQADRLAELRAEVTAWMKENGDEGKLYAKPRLLTDPDRAKPPAKKGGE